MAKWEIEGQFHLQQHIMDKVPGYCGRNERTDLTARVIVKSDLDKPDVKQLLFPDLSKYLK